MIKDKELSKRDSERSTYNSSEYSDVSSVSDADDKLTQADRSVSIDYDEAVRLYGSGRYQVFIIGLLVFITFPAVFNNNGYIFIGAFQNHTCQVPDSHNWTNPATNRTVEVRYTAGECSYTIEHKEQNSSVQPLREVFCDSWDYDTRFFQTTVTSEWDLNNCRGKWKIALASSLFMFGFFVGCFLLADFADKFGRLRCLVLSSVAQAVVGVVASFSVNIEMLMAMRLLLGLFTAGTRNAGFSLICEITQHRTAAGMVIGSFYALGGLVVTAISQLLPNWRHFQLACALSYLAFVPYYWVVPESPRWLLSQGRTEEVISYFKRSSRFNKIELPSGFSVYLERCTSSSQKSSILLILKKAVLRRLVLLCALIWFSLSAVYFGLQYNVGNLSGNIFTNNYLIQSIGVIQICCMWLLFFGRKVVVLSGCALITVIVGVVPFLNYYDAPKEIIVALAVIGKLTAQVLFEFLYIIISEIFPTTVRTSAVGFGSGFARVGGAISPYIVFSHDMWQNLPFIIFCGLALVSTIATFFIPETKGRKLPDTIEEAEIANGLSGCRCLCLSDTESVVSSNSTELTESDNEKPETKI